MPQCYVRRISKKSQETVVQHGNFISQSHQAFSTPKLNLPIHLTHEAYKSNVRPASSCFPPKIMTKWNIIQACKGNCLILVILDVPLLIWTHDFHRQRKTFATSPVHRFIGRVDWNFISCPGVFRDCTLKDPLICKKTQTTNTQITNSPLVKAKLALKNSCVWNPFFPHTVKKKSRWDPAAIEHPEDIVT